MVQFHSISAQVAVSRIIAFIISSQSDLSYRVVPGHRNWQVEIAVWNFAGFLHCALETRWQQFWQFLNDFLNDFLYENLNFLYANLRFSL